MPVARSRELVAQGRPAAVVTRVAGISRQAIYRRPKRPPTGQRRRLDPVDRVVLAVARANPSDGTRMVAALAGRELGARVNRKRGSCASTPCCNGRIVLFFEGPEDEAPDVLFERGNLGGGPFPALCEILAP